MRRLSGTQRIHIRADLTVEKLGVEAATSSHFLLYSSSISSTLILPLERSTRSLLPVHPLTGLLTKLSTISLSHLYGLNGLVGNSPAPGHEEFVYT